MGVATAEATAVVIVEEATVAEPAASTVAAVRGAVGAERARVDTEVAEAVVVAVELGEEGVGKHTSRAAGWVALV